MVVEGRKTAKQADGNPRKQAGRQTSKEMHATGLSRGGGRGEEEEKGKTYNSVHSCFHTAAST